MTLISYYPLNGDPRDRVGTNHGTWIGTEAYASDSPTGVSSK